MSEQLALEPLCEYCGEPYLVDLLECWPEERAWMFETCCEGAHEDLCWSIEHNEEGVRESVRALFAEYGIEIRRPYSSESEMAIRLDFGLRLESITLAEAKAFVATHHRHNRPPVGWRWGHAVYNGDTLVAVAMVGRPVARMIPGATVCEVTRLCVDPTLDRELSEHACSMLYGAAARETKRRGFAKIITYTLETERGTSLKGAGWTAEHRTRAEKWSRKSRPRAEVAPAGRKIRWARTFKPSKEAA